MAGLAGFSLRVINESGYGDDNPVVDWRLRALAMGRRTHWRALLERPERRLGITRWESPRGDRLRLLPLAQKPTVVRHCPVVIAAGAAVPSSAMKGLAAVTATGSPPTFRMCTTSTRFRNATL